MPRRFDHLVSFGPVLLLLPLLFLGGCSGGDSTGPTPQPTPAFTLQASPGSLSVVQGQTGTVNLSVTRSGGFTGAVQVAVEGLPTAVSAPAVSVAGAASSGSVVVTVGSQAAPGTFTLTLRATGPGVEARTAQVTLTVEEAPTPGFTLAVSPTSATLEAGKSTEISVAITRSGGFEGSVTLSAVSLPSGVTAVFDPPAPAGGVTTSTLTLSSLATATVGSAEIQVRGSAQGIGDRSAPLALTVTAPPPPVGQEVSWDFCGVSGVPNWVAVQDGDGPWTRVQGTGGRYVFQLASDRGAVAWATPETGGAWAVEVLYATREELTLQGGQRCPEGPGVGKTVNGSVAGLSGLPTIETAFISLGGALPEAAPTGLTPTFTVSGVPEGPVDLLATAATISSASGSATPRRMILRRGIEPAAGSTLPVLDFAGGEAFDPVVRTLTVTGSGGDALVAGSLFWTAGGAQAVTGINLQGSTSASWFGVPGARRVAGDLHLVSASTTTSLTDPLAPSRTTIRLVEEVEDLTLPMGPHLGAVTASSMDTGVRRGRVEVNLPAEYDQYWVADFEQGAAPARRSQVQMTRGYRGAGGGTLALEVPDFTGVEGWNADWGMRVGFTMVWTLSATGWSGGTSGLPTDFRQPGFEYRSASRQGEL